MKKYVAEFLGTLALVFVGTGGVVFSAASTQSPLTIALGFGLTLAAAIYVFGPISGGHFNPAVSFGFALSKRLSWIDFAGYVLSQILGAIVGSGLVYGGAYAYLKSSTVTSALQGQNMTLKQFIDTVGLGDTKFATGQWKEALFIETIITAAFVLVILLITQRVAVATVAPLVIGLTLTVLILVGFGITGGSLNPARSLAPAIFVQGTALTEVWVYFVGPLVGAGIAALIAKFLKYDDVEVA